MSEKRNAFKQMSLSHKHFIVRKGYGEQELTSLVRKSVSSVVFMGGNKQTVVTQGKQNGVNQGSEQSRQVRFMAHTSFP